MEQTKYKPINPREVFAVTVKRIIRHDMREKMYYEYSVNIKVNPTGSEFIDLFAGLVVRHGKLRAADFAAMMGVPDYKLRITIDTLCGGVGILELTDIYLCVVVEALLSQTNWKMVRIAQQVKLSVGLFNQFFTRCYNCTPTKWRRDNRLIDN